MSSRKRNRPKKNSAKNAREKQEAAIVGADLFGHNAPIAPINPIDPITPIGALS